MRPSEFARYLGVSPGYISNLKRDGRLVLSCDGRIIVVESINRIEATSWRRQPKAVLGSQPNLIATLSAQDHRVSKIVRMHYQVIRLKSQVAARQAIVKRQ